MRPIFYRCIHSEGTFVRKDIGSKPQSIVCVLRKVLYEIPVWLRIGVAICRRQALAVLGVGLASQGLKLIFVSDVFQQYYIFCV
jgi:hypothetical protein